VPNDVRLFAPFDVGSHAHMSDNGIPFDCAKGSVPPRHTSTRRGPRVWSKRRHSDRPTGLRHWAVVAAAAVANVLVLFVVGLPDRIVWWVVVVSAAIHMGTTWPSLSPTGELIALLRTQLHRAPPRY